MRNKFTLVFYFLMVGTGFCSVSTNPFLRPGSGSQKPPVIPNQTPQPQVKKPEASKEIEFKGYYILNGEPFFCLNNKKTGHAEWLSVSESTFDEFLIEQFDHDTEQLTISFEGSTFTLSLIDSSSTANNPTSKSVTSSSASSLPANKKVTRVMPPRPRTTPTLPSWLVNQRSNSSVNNNNSPQTPITRNSPSYSGAVPRRTFSGPFFPGQSGSSNLMRDDPTISSGQSIQNRTTNSVPGAAPSQGSSISETNKQIDVAPTETSPVDAVENGTEAEFSLENLPPPPPPPNILPPSPPPDIQPSRDE